MTTTRLYTNKTEYTEYSDYQMFAFTKRLCSTGEDALSPSELLKTLYAIGIVNQSSEDDEQPYYNEKLYIFRNTDEYTTQSFFVTDLTCKKMAYYGDRVLMQNGLDRIDALIIANGIKALEEKTASLQEIYSIVQGMKTQLQTYNYLDDMCLGIAAIFFCEKSEPLEVDQDYIQHKVNQWRGHYPMLCRFFLPLGMILTAKYGAELNSAALTLAILKETIQTTMGYTQSSPEPSQDNTIK